MGWNSVSTEQAKSSQESTSKARWEKELERMIISIIEKKPVLWMQVVERSLGDKLNLDDWEEMFSEVVDGTHPWGDAAKHWGILGADKKVCMSKFLGRWVVNMEMQEYTSFLTSAVRSVYESIIALDMDLQQTMKLFDTDGDGTVELKEVRQVLGMFDLGLTASQMDRLTGQIFVSCVGSAEGKAESTNLRLKVDEFLARFTLIYKQAGEIGSEEIKLEKWMLQALDQIGRMILRTPADKLVSDVEKAALAIQKNFRGHEDRKRVAELKSSPGDAPAPACKEKNKKGAEAEPEGVSKMVALFSALDSSGDGILQIDEFVTSFQRLPDLDKVIVDGQKMTRERIQAIANAIDTSKNGTINYLEFLQAFEASGDGHKDLGDTLGEDITTVLFRHRMAIRMGCLYLDEEGSGKIRAEDFTKVLQGINSVLSRPERALTNTQILLLAEALAKEEDDDAFVDYETFLRAFVILDTERSGAVVKRFN